MSAAGVAARPSTDSRAASVRAAYSGGQAGGSGADSLGCRVIVAYLLLAAPVVAVALFWGSWGWVAAAAAVAVIEYATLHRSQQFASRIWRSLRMGRRSSRERNTETLYVISAIAGVALLAIAVVSAV